METQKINKIAEREPERRGRNGGVAPETKVARLELVAKAANRDCRSLSGAPPPRTAGRSPAGAGAESGLPAMSGAMLASPNMRSTSPPSPADEAGCTCRGGSKDSRRVRRILAPRPRSRFDLRSPALRHQVWKCSHARGWRQDVSLAPVKPSRRPVKPGRPISSIFSRHYGKTRCREP